MKNIFYKQGKKALNNEWYLIEDTLTNYIQGGCAVMAVIGVLFNQIGISFVLILFYVAVAFTKAKTLNDYLNENKNFYISEILGNSLSFKNKKKYIFRKRKV